MERARNIDPRFVINEFEPAYLRLYRAGGLPARVDAALAELAHCHSCPRSCEVDRLRDQVGVCRTGRRAVVASAGAHLGEESCLSGWNGSGTIFFSLCNLHCVFCQNADISQAKSGRECDADAIAALMLGLQERDCHNVNFVTPEHVAPQVIEAIARAIPQGLRIPIVYNTSAYDAMSTLQLLDGLVDIYMPDFKFWNSDTAGDLCKAPDYPARARGAIQEMHRQVGLLRFGPDGLARRGLLVRHLVLPGMVNESGAIFDWMAREVSPDTFVNIMGQYRPCFRVGAPDGNGARRFAHIDRAPRVAEIQEARAAARRAGLWRFDERC